MGKIIFHTIIYTPLQCFDLNMHWEGNMIWDKSFLMLLTFDPLAPMGNRLNWKNRAASVERKKFLVCAQMCFRSKMCVSITNMQLCLHFQEQDRAKTFTLADTKLSTEVNIVKMYLFHLNYYFIFLCFVF